MTKSVTITLHPDDAEPFLRKAAYDAAMHSAWLDHITRKTGNHPGATGEKHEDSRKRWMVKYLAAKRIVEAFGIEFEPTSEQETLTVSYHYIGGVTKRGAMGFNITTGSQPDYDNPYPSYRGGVHAEACRQAADRVVRRWRDACK